MLYNNNDEKNDNESSDIQNDSTIDSFIKPKIITDYDPERRKLALVYTRKSRWYSLILMIGSFIFSFIILLSKITIPIKSYISETISDNPFIIVGVFFIGIFLIMTLAEFPISFFLHSRLSRRYGLSKLTNRKWMARYLKGAIISFFISFPLFEGFYWFLRIFPDNWWIWTTIALIIFSVILSNLAPILILPRFYKFELLEKDFPDLTAELLRMTEKVGIKTTSAFKWKLGEFSTVGNAALLGIGNTRRIIIADTILEKYTKEEIKWILAHELGHHKRHDLWKGMILGSLTTFLTFYLTHLLFLPITVFLGYPPFIYDISSLPVLGLIFWGINTFILNIPSLWYSRRTEQATDRFATTLIPEFPIIKSLFIKMADQNLSDIEPPLWERILFMSHPSIKDRILNAEKIIFKK